MIIKTYLILIKEEVEDDKETIELINYIKYCSPEVDEFDIDGNKIKKILIFIIIFHSIFINNLNKNL